jgi:hypothetical protein
VPIKKFPVQTPVVDDDGLINKIWLRHLQDDTAATSTVPAIGAAAGLVNQTLTSNSAIASPYVPVDGALLIVRVVQDGTGRWTITFAAAFMGTTTDINGDPGKSTMFLFAGIGGNWWMVGNPMREQ